MGASAPVPPWTTEDDLLLKNAVEHGASLESLAKGAVRFSRRFTIQELQNRWHALLYDPVESAEASARMIGFMCSASYPSKPNRFEDSKESKSVSGKRKAKGVRSCYYSMRKNRIFDLRYLDFLLGPGDGHEPCPANCMFGGPISNHFGFQDSSFDITHHTLSQFGTGSIATSNVGVTANAFFTGFQNPIEEELHIAHNNMHKQIPLPFGAGIPFSMSCSGVEEMGQLKEVPVSSVLEAHDSQEKTAVISDQSNGNRANVCSEFGDIRVFNSRISDCCTSIHNLGFQKPTWSTVVSTPAIPYVHLNENEQHMGKAFVVPEDGGMNNTNTSGYNVASLDSEQGDQIPCENTKNLTPGSEEHVAELSNTPLNFKSMEFYFMEAKGKDGTDKSDIDGFSSLLLDSPNVPNIAALEAKQGDQIPCDNTKNSTPSSKEHVAELSNTPLNFKSMEFYFMEANGKDAIGKDGTDKSYIDGFSSLLLDSPNVPNIAALEAAVPPDKFVAIFGGEQCKESDEKGQYYYGDGHAVFSSGSQILPCVSALHPQFPELHDGASCCTSNAENTEIPCDDDVYLPNQMLPSSFLSVTELKSHEAGIPTLKDEAGDFELAERLNYNADFYLEMPACNFNCNNGENVSGSQLEVDDSELAVKHSPADHEETPSGSEGDVPQFSDVEQMILDMDLSPDDRDLYSGRKVSRYQHVDSKRSIFPRYQHVDSKKSIIRLEQAAHSFMQKALASRGAFAVLYGHRSTFYIKKPEVLIGRATEGFDVDIDLGREGSGNKISQRQAIIKVDESGSFYLTNLGKHPIFVNSRKVAPRDSVVLTSSCLIEVRGISFIFETKSKFF